ncbi:DUF4153 domain-containing protein [Segetibacter koreensis]|uniref:DUF4153 domain-containing protein n=1 Tax=Segetibacter koreensis TaxID=398037 RepID=UPI000478133F|nr:DUF4153 domain-containing protein [Segetibacter koreensis]
MKNDILLNIDDPHQLEKLYRQNKSAFRQQFSLAYPELKENKVADFWNERLNYESEEVYWGTTKDITFVIIASILAGTIAKLPAFFNLDEAYFYQRNIGFIIFPILTLYFSRKNKFKTKAIIFIGVAMLVSLIFINFLPHQKKSDSLLLSCIHLPLFLWCILGYAFVGGSLGNYEKRLGFLRYNGDLVVMTTVILIAGGILTGVTIGLFKLIDLKIEKFYFENVVIFGVAAVPIVATYLTDTNPQIVNKISPVIAKIFSPLVLITLIAYLVGIVISGKDPYNDREFLLIFNALLIGVMAIILFSVAGTSKSIKKHAETFVLFLLSVLTVIVNGIALSAILFRISEWGISPNRVAVLGGNILMLTNLILVTIRLLKALTKKSDKTEVGAAIALFLPFYAIWAFLVTFFLPLIFNFK